jgi:hypothetical protein
MRRFALAAAVMAIGCNSVLGIPERELGANNDGAIIDAPVDSTVDAPDTTFELDSDMDTTVAETDVDTGVDVAVDSTVDSTMDMGVDTAVDSGVDTGVDAGADTKKDTGVDSTAVDTAMADTADTAMPDTADTSVADTAMPTCGVVGTPCCGGIPASCNTNAVCNSATKMCVAATGACVRSADCAGSACGGPTACGTNICFACTPTFGAKAFGEACSARSECSSGVCDTFRGVCSGACSNGITADADCAVYGAKAICTELTYTTMSVTGDVGFCAQGCERDADCATGKACRLSGNDDAKRLDLSCTPPAGSTAYGSPCTTGSQCPNGVCITFGATSLCTPFCASNVMPRRVGVEELRHHHLQPPGRRHTGREGLRALADGRA